MTQIRVIPCLLLKNLGLVKTIKFKEPKYIGDPRNAVKIFNEKEVDELAILDITATIEKRSPQFKLIEEIVSEAFMPVAYGGGIRNVKDAQNLINIGVEKIIINTYAHEDPGFIGQVSEVLGSQSVVVCIDVKHGLLGRYEVYSASGKKNMKVDPVSFAISMAKMGAGELIIQSMDRDGTMQGYDVDLIRSVSSRVDIPVIALGGAGEINDFKKAVDQGAASAVAAGSMFVFQGKHRAVLISYPEQATLKKLFAD